MCFRFGWLACGVTAVLFGVCGCSDDSGSTVDATASAPESAGSTATKAAQARPERKPVVVKRDSFAGVPQALAALVAAIKANDHHAVATAEGWFELQGAAAVPELIAVVEDGTAGLESRLSACRALARVGPPAAEALERELTIEPQQLQVRVMESLSRIKPARPSTIAKFRELIKPGDGRVRQAALASLGRLGPQAKDSVPDLLAILNDANEEEALRSEAKKSLKAVDPRRGLMGVAQ